MAPATRVGDSTLPREKDGEGNSRGVGGLRPCDAVFHEVAMGDARPEAGRFSPSSITKPSPFPARPGAPDKRVESTLALPAR